MPQRHAQASIEFMIALITYTGCVIAVVFALDVAAVYLAAEAQTAAVVSGVAATGDRSPAEDALAVSFGSAPDLSLADGGCALAWQATGIEALDARVAAARLQLDQRSPLPWGGQPHAAGGVACLPTGSLRLEVLGAGLLQLDPAGLLGGADELLAPLFDEP